MKTLRLRKVCCRPIKANFKCRTDGEKRKKWWWWNVSSGYYYCFLTSESCLQCRAMIYIPKIQNIKDIKVSSALRWNTHIGFPIVSLSFFGVWNHIKKKCVIIMTCPGLGLFRLIAIHSPAAVFESFKHDQNCMIFKMRHCHCIYWMW